MAVNTLRDPEIIKKLRAILDANLGNERFGVQELAKEAGLSRSSLHRKVHAYNGNSTTHFIREYRLQKAMELLQKEDLTVSEVAYQVGFSSPTYFNTCFKEYYGYPPGEAKVRAISKEHKNEISDKPYSQPPNNDRIKLLHRKLNYSKRWLAVLAIGIAVLVTWATSFYLSTSNNTQAVENDSFSTKNSIAVLPFKNWSGDSGLEYISDGMTNAVITRLSFVDNLRVIPFTSVQKYKFSDKDAPSIAKDLEVQYILQGSFELSGELVKFTLDLIDGYSNTLVSSEDYTGAWNEDVFSMQAAAVGDLISELHVDIKSNELIEIEHLPTENKEAYDTWLKANYQALKYTKKGMMNAIILYEEAIRLDSNFIEPYINQAELYGLAGASFGLYSESEAWNNAKKLLIRANEIDSNNLNAKVALNDGLYMYEWDFDTMEKCYQTTSALKVFYCLQTGRYEEALALIEKRLATNPTNSVAIALKTLAFSLMNRSEEAITLLNESDDLYSDDFIYLTLASRVYFYLKDYESSYALLNKFMHIYQERLPIVLWMLAACEYQKGNIEAAEKYVEEIKNKYKEEASGSPAWFLALYYASIGDHDTALIWLENSYERHEMEMIWLREELPLKPLRTDPRYLELYNKVGFPMPPNPGFPMPPLRD